MELTLLLVAGLPESQPNKVHALTKDQDQTRCGKNRIPSKGQARIPYRKIMDEDVWSDDLVCPAQEPAALPGLLPEPAFPERGPRPSSRRAATATGHVVGEDR